MDLETSKNKEWKRVAQENTSLCLARLDLVDKKRKIPVFVTAEVIYKVLLNDGVKRKSAKELYAESSLIPIPPNENKLLRPMIPFFRHQDYLLSKHNSYKEKIRRLIE
jgi:hypothetical protein